MRRELYADEHEEFRRSVRAFIEKEVVPSYTSWSDAGVVGRELYERAGELGFLAMDVDQLHGGGGVRDFRYNVVIAEEVERAEVRGAGLGWTVHNDVCVPYFDGLGDDEQKRRWLPDICAGRSITAIAMTEPGAGSDLAAISTTAVRDGETYLVNGGKTFISNGILADLVVCAVKTDPTQRHAGISLLVIERGMIGFERGRNLDKLGCHAQDTAELFFTDVRVPVANRLGEEGRGFDYLTRNLPRERLSIAVAAVAGARAALDATIAYTATRTAFGQPISAFQNTRFELAEMATEIEIAETYTDRCVLGLNAGELTADEAAMAKWWTTDLHCRVADRCVQLHGGYGYMAEYPIARAFADSRISKIYGGTNEIMKEIIGRKIAPRVGH